MEEIFNFYDENQSASDSIDEALACATHHIEEEATRNVEGELVNIKVNWPVENEGIAIEVTLE
jgi:hypothetical protein